MSLVSARELAEYQQTEVAVGMAGAVERAEAIVALSIGTEQLAERQLTKTIYPMRNRETLDLPDGPATGVVSVTSDGTALDLGDVVHNKWAICYRGGFTEGAKVVVTYTAGYTVNNLPAGLRLAILMIASDLYTRGGGNQGITAERIGDYSVAYAAGGVQVPALALDSLAKFKNPLQGVM